MSAGSACTRGVKCASAAILTENRGGRLLQESRFTILHLEVGCVPNGLLPTTQARLPPRAATARSGAWIRIPRIRRRHARTAARGAEEHKHIPPRAYAALPAQTPHGCSPPARAPRRAQRALSTHTHRHTRSTLLSSPPAPIRWSAPLSALRRVCSCGPRLWPTYGDGGLSSSRPRAWVLS